MRGVRDHKALFALLVALALLSAVSCAPFQATETPAQQFFAAQGTYNVILQVAVNYAKNPAADPEVVMEIAAADLKAQEAIAAGQIFVRTMTPGDSGDELLSYARVILLAAQAVRTIMIREEVVSE